MLRRRTVLILVMLALGMAVAAYWGIEKGVLRMPGKGDSALERWCAGQIRDIAGDLLVPRLDFQSFRLILPNKVELHDAALVADGLPILEAAVLRLRLQRLPRTGEPLVIKSIQLERPILRLHVGSDGALRGFDDLLRSTKGETQEDGGSTRPSDVFAVRRFVVVGGEIEYSVLSGHTMNLPDLDFELTCAPSDEPGWYGVEAALHREPVFELDYVGRFSIDEVIVELEKVVTRLELGPDQVRYLPPSLQTIAEEHELRGRLDATTRGVITVLDPDRIDLHSEISIASAFASFGGRMYPIDRLDAAVRHRGGRLAVDPIYAQIFGGVLDGRIEVEFAGAVPVEWEASGRDLRLERALRHAAGGQGKLVGRTQLDLRGRIDADTGLPSLQMEATLDVTDASLRDDPIFGGLMREVGGDLGRAGDRGSCRLTLDGTRARLTDVRLVAGPSAARGKGAIWYDGTVDFRFNAGPLERIQALLGNFGEWLGQLTDGLVTYQVTGTLAEPKFDVRPLGWGMAEEEAPPAGAERD